MMIIRLRKIQTAGRLNKSLSNFMNIIDFFHPNTIQIPYTVSFLTEIPHLKVKISSNNEVPFFRAGYIHTTWILLQTNSDALQPKR